MVYRFTKFRCDWFTKNEDRNKPKHVKKNNMIRVKMMFSAFAAEFLQLPE